MATLILALASLPVLHDLHSGTHSLVASIIAALAAVICGTLAYRGRLIPLALAAGLDVGFGIGLPRGSSAIGALLRILPKNDADTADTLVTIGAVAMFVAAICCVIAIPSALNLRQCARAELAPRGTRRPDFRSGQALGQHAEGIRPIAADADSDHQAPARASRS